MNRDRQLDRLLDDRDPWDIVVIGGGATGSGIAVDAASRGYRVALLEQADFGKGTSSRSTKLVHGGVRYLQQGNVSLVMDALKERGTLLRNAPHLVHDLAFVVPNYQWWEAPFYGIGLKVYDLLAGRFGFGRSRLLSTDEVLKRLPTLERDGLRGGVLYHDGQFDDARMLVALVRTAVDHGAVALNGARIVALKRNGAGFVNGCVFHDEESGREHALAARCIINATGAFSDAVRRLDDPTASPRLAPSQGVHLSLDRSFLPGDTAIMVPRTPDGRILFAIPWQGHVLVGTTDTPVGLPHLEPKPLNHEIDFLLETAGTYLAKPPGRADVLSAFAGIRPLARAEGVSSTAAMSRDHTLEISKSGLLTVAGGKWTTYRRMAEDAIEHAVVLGGLEERPCITRDLKIHGADAAPAPRDPLAVYGSDADAIRALARAEPALAEPLHPQLPILGAQIVFAAREEMARSVDDALSRRTRALQLNAAAAIAMAPAVARLLRRELHEDEAWERRQVESFRTLAAGYLVGGTPTPAAPDSTPEPG